WDDPRLVVLVLANQDLNQVTWEQRAMEGDPQNPMTQRIPEVNYAAYADLIGLKGIRVETPDEIEGAWDHAFSADRPVVVDALCGGQAGIGYTYAHGSAAQLIEDKLQEAVRGCDAMDVRAAWRAMSAALRNIGRPGLGFMAISAVDLAFWDLKARLLDQPLVAVLDAAHDR